MTTKPTSNGHVELYRRLRPRSLDYMVGNEETVNSLRSMLEAGTLPHAILFSGPRGCGKTSLVHILKTEMQCSDLDFEEKNSASDRGIQKIRDLQRTMWNAPAIGPCRICFMDEAHRLTPEAQDAMLKMTENPPGHYYIFLATTEPEKLIKTLRDRFTPMPVRLLTEEEMGGIIDEAVRKQKYSITTQVRDLLIAGAQGSARMLLVLLEKVAALNPKQQERAVELELEKQSVAYDLCQALINRKKWPEVCKILANMKDDPEPVRRAVLGYARATLLKSRDRESGYRAWVTIDVMERHLFDSGAAGLAARCFEICTAKGE